MCGITGFLHPNPVDHPERLLRRMNDSMVHRGPDDDGAIVSNPADGAPQVGLAMRRLSIIDLQSGHQPISNEDDTCTVVFNGEIYNHLELRSELEAAGHRFKTRSDTEAILHAYEEWGDQCVDRLRGMFGFAIWDSSRQRLFVARDAVGIKPLYWTQARGGIAFASEIKAILHHPDVTRSVDETALSDYLTYLYVPPPRTMFAGIQKLPPGHCLVWEAGSVRVREWWDGPNSLLRSSPTGDLGPNDVWEHLRESVHAHLLADVPLGAFLSGGLDSLAVVAAMSEVCTEPIRTYTVGFDGGGLYNELEPAELVSKHFGTLHRSMTIGPDCVRDLPEIVRLLDEPLADASVLPNYAVSRLARTEVKVALSGAGGDELFGGYQRYRGDEMAKSWKRIPGFLRNQILLPLLRRMPNRGDTAIGDKVRLAQKFLEPLDFPSDRRYLAWNSFFDVRLKKELLCRASPRDSFDAALPYFSQVSSRPFVDQAMFVDLKTYLPGDPLFLADRMTMGNSLEGRVPFVDRKLMEVAYRISADQKLRDGVTKLIIRKALAGRVPPSILERPKRGFGTPTDLWLRGPWKPLAETLLSPEALKKTGYFQAEAVQRLMAQHQSGSRDFSQHLWAILVFQIWHALYIEGNGSPEPRPDLAGRGYPGWASSTT